MNRKAKALEFVEAGYNINVTGRHVQITDSMKDYAMDKISKIERFMDRIIDVNVIMDIQKLDHRVELILKAGNIKIRSLAVSTDMYASIDKAVAKLEAQIRRYKSKIQDHHAKGHAVLDMTVNVVRSPEADLDRDILDMADESINGMAAELLKPHEIISQETRPLKILSYEEAIMKMDLSHDMFMLFKHEVDQKLKVIYRRTDGNYGIIEPSC